MYTKKNRKDIAFEKRGKKEEKRKISSSLPKSRLLREQLVVVVVAMEVNIVLFILFCVFFWRDSRAAKGQKSREILEKFVTLCNSFFLELFCAQYDEEHSQRVGRAR